MKPQSHSKSFDTPYSLSPADVVYRPQMQNPVFISKSKKKKIVISKLAHFEWLERVVEAEVNRKQEEVNQKASLTLEPWNLRFSLPTFFDEGSRLG